jgi:deazaflavin-dependent oxidoreductase (nitroreductase family)
MANWKYFGIAHKQLYRLSGGRLGKRMGWIDVALLETTGRKSGKIRTTPLACYPWKGSIAVSASNNGQENHPAWFLNLQDNPEVTVQTGKTRFKAIAEQVTGQEKEALWKVVTDINKHQTQYRATTERDIPLVFFRKT